MPLSAGTGLGPYEVVAPLGAGDMGKRAFEGYSPASVIAANHGTSGTFDRHYRPACAGSFCCNAALREILMTDATGLEGRVGVDRKRVRRGSHRPHCGFGTYTRQCVLRRHSCVTVSKGPIRRSSPTKCVVGC